MRTHPSDPTTRPRLTALGELLIDWTPAPEGDGLYRAQPGGAPANVACTAAAYGIDTAFIGAVGTDRFGAHLIRTLDERGVATDGIVRTDLAFTTMAFVTLDAAGERSFSFARKPGADTCLELSDRHRALLDRTDALHVGTLSLTDEPAAEATRAAVARVRAHGGIISFDPNVREALWSDPEALRAACDWGFGQCTYTKISRDDLAALTDTEPAAAVDALMARHPGLLLTALTEGADGCTLFYRAKDRVRVVAGPPGPPVRPVDTTGAGDVFTGALLSRILDRARDAAGLRAWLDTAPERELAEVAYVANTTAGRSTERPGGIGGDDWGPSLR